MIKLYNFVCINCEKEEEFFVDEDNPEILSPCKNCGKELVLFNFKNNNQRTYINDPIK